MSEQNRIYELTRLLNNTAPLNEDMLKAIDILKDNFQNNYVRRLVNAAGSEQEDAKRHPSREVVLLKALKGFSSDGSRRSIDRAIEMMTTFQALGNVQHTLNAISENQTSIKMKSSDSDASLETISPSSINATRLLLALELMRKL